MRHPHPLLTCSREHHRIRLYEPLMVAPSLIPGQSLGHFRLIEVIGHGGMGVVYRARDTRLERDVAIKVLNTHSLDDSTARKRFRGEALILSRLNHPNVESVYEFRSEEDIDFLVLEYVPGITLNELLQHGHFLPEKEVISLGLQLARGLAAAHSQRVLHRDLKPGNLRVTPDHVLKILDFGLSELFALPEDETLTEAEVAHHARAGTPAYLSPEQVQGKEPDTRSDIYSAGMVLYEMCTGSKPFPQGGQMLVEAILRSLPPAPRLKNPDISPGLEAVILRCLEKDPNLRYQSAGDLLQDFERLATGLDTTISGFHSHAWRLAVRRRKATFIAVGLGALLLAVAAGLLLWRRPPLAAEQKILAVLPMDTVGQDPATTALGLGLTETVTAKLVQASDSAAIQVVSPQDLRDQGVKTAEDARRQFGTDLVLESSLQRSGQTIRINTFLVDSKTHRQRSARTIEAQTNDPFGLQDQVVSAALDMLPTHLTAEERLKLNVVHNTQPAAYEAYIRGRGYLQAYEKPENIENAILEFNQALKIDPNYALAYAGLGDAYWTEFHRLDKGNEVLARASHNCEKALALNPELVEGHVCLGNILNSTGKYDKAVEEFKRALESNKQSDYALRGLADAYSNLGNFSAAESAYKQAIALRPNYWGVYSWLGLYYYEQSRYADAAEMFKKATQLAPDNYQGYITLGGVYITEGKYQDAIAAFHRSIDLRPSADAYNNLGYTLFLMHRFPESVKAQEQALSLNDANWEIWGNLADALYWSPDRRSEAQAKYRRAIELAKSRIQVNPKDARVLVYLAGYSAMVDDRTAAFQYLQRALQVAGSDSEVLFRAAIVYNHFGQTDQTLAYLKKAADLGYSRPIIKDTPELESLQHSQNFIALTNKAS